MFKKSEVFLEPGFKEMEIVGFGKVKNRNGTPFSRRNTKELTNLFLIFYF